MKLHYQGTWSVVSGSGNFDNLNNPNATVSGMSQGVNRFVWSLANGVCPISSDTVEITKASNPIVDAGEDQTIFKDDRATLEVSSNVDNDPQVQYRWEPAFYLSSNTNKITETNAFLEETTEFEVQVTSSEGCIGRDSIIINLNSMLTFSGAFTPNGDGKNDLWLIKNLGDPTISTHRVSIFDGFGSEVFNSTNFQGWDGRFNGNDLPVASYYYSVEVSYSNGETGVETGIVTLLR